MRKTWNIQQIFTVFMPHFLSYLSTNQEILMISVQSTKTSIIYPPYKINIWEQTPREPHYYICNPNDKNIRPTNQWFYRQPFKTTLRAIIEKH